MTVNEYLCILPDFPDAQEKYVARLATSFQEESCLFSEVMEIDKG